MEGFFVEITLLLGIATVLAILFRVLKQPPILAYILTGIIVGPLHLLNPEAEEAIHVFSELGITLLLFMLGLELKLSELRFVGKVSILVGLGQVVVTSIVGFFITVLLGFDPIGSIYIATGLTFSSTIIIIKLLSDKKELGTLHGKISTGILLVQDFLAIIALVLLNGIANGANSSPLEGILVTLGKSAIMFALVVIGSKLIFPKLVHYLSKSSEILFVFSLGWAFGIATIASSDIVGLSIEIGGFLAGLALANTVESFQIITRIRPLRDFFIILFFINLGMGLDLMNISSVLPEAIVLSIFVLIGNPLIVMILMRGLGYHSQTSFKTGLSVAQISEFSLILIFLALNLGYVDERGVAVMTLVGIITFTVSTYGILNSHQLYKYFRKPLRTFQQKRTKHKINITDSDLKQHVVIIGANRVGINIIEKLKTSEQDIVVIDYDPGLAEEFADDKHVFFISGDAADMEVQEAAKMEQAEVIVSTIPNVEDNVILITHIKQVNPKVKIISTVHRDYYAKALYAAGADHVIYPYSFVGNSIGNFVRRKSYDKLDVFDV